VDWGAGTPELDHVMAVGVREMYDQLDEAVSPMVHTWDGARWHAFGEAKPLPVTPHSGR